MISIRNASTADAARLREIYSYYVEKTAITFEYDVPTLGEFEGRIKKTLAKYPYLVAENDGVVVGYAYAGTFVGRAAYDRSAEVSIYLDREAQGQGAGRLLYQELESRLAQMNLTNLYACIGVPAEKDDEFLTFNSRQVDEHMGYRLAGRFSKCGYKFGRWYDMVWMEKFIKEHEPTPPDVIWNNV